MLQVQAAANLEYSQQLQNELQQLREHMARITTHAPLTLWPCKKDAEPLHDRNDNANYKACTNNLKKPSALYFPSQEKDVIMWRSFDRKYVYSTEQELQVTHHGGNSRKELQEAITASKKYLGVDADKSYKWVHGQVSFDTRRGITYAMDFKARAPGSQALKMRRVTVFKPIETSIIPAQMPEQQAREHEASLFAFLNIIVPVPSHQLGMFTKYMSMYAKAALAPVGADTTAIKLVVVYFASSQVTAPAEKQAVEDMLSVHKSAYPKFEYKLLLSTVPFSRALGVQLGVEEVTFSTPQGDNTLLHFSDPDLRYTEEFLFRCRISTVASKRVYFPVSFSMYPLDPAAINVDGPESGLRAKYDTGHWRTHNFGHPCIFLADYTAFGGFASEHRTIAGGAEEDLYRRILAKKKLEVVRGSEEDLKQVHHEKGCNHTLQAGSVPAYAACVETNGDFVGVRSTVRRRLSMCITSQQHGNNGARADVDASAKQ